MKVIISVCHLSITLYGLQCIFTFPTVMLSHSKIFQLTSGLNLFMKNIRFLRINATQYLKVAVGCCGIRTVGCLEIGFEGTG